MEAIKMREFFGTVYEQVRAMHHVTTSYAVHKALNKFYDSWAELTDDFIETWQGRYGRIQGEYEIEVNTVIQPTEFITRSLETLRNEIYATLSPTDPDLQNICADMIGLCNKTIYLLSLK